MFPLGHAGITLALAVALTSVLKIEWKPEIFAVAVVGGAWLPDIIDKPIGLLMGYPGGGRLVAHSLLFALTFTFLVFLISRFLGPKLKIWTSFAPYVPFVVFGLWIHLVLDEIWNTPRTFLWPAYGWGFPAGEFDLSQALLNPITLAGEIVGTAILVVFVVWCFRLKKMSQS